MVYNSCQDFAILLIMWSAEKLSEIMFVGRSNLWEVGERGKSGGGDVLLQLLVDPAKVHPIKRIH